MIGDDGRLPRFTASYGVTDSDKGATSLDDLISEADAALYEAKADGKNRLVTRQSLQAVTPLDIALDDEDDGPHAPSPLTRILELWTVAVQSGRVNAAYRLPVGFVDSPV